MTFKDRTEAGKMLAEKLKQYKGKDVQVYALPRGGVVTAVEIAKYLHAPLGLIITRKITHPTNPEYAIAAVAGNGHIIWNPEELLNVDLQWVEETLQKERQEAERRRKLYLQGRRMVSPEGKIAILVDDGVATGLTLRVGILELKHRKPRKLVVAVPVVPGEIAKILQTEAGELVSLAMPSRGTFIGAVGAYYEDFSQVEDQEVVRILTEHEAWLQHEQMPRVV